jgi:hypothetical protein
MPPMENVYTKLSNGQIINRKRVAYQKAKRDA